MKSLLAAGAAIALLAAAAVPAQAQIHAQVQVYPGAIVAPPAVRVVPAPPPPVWVPGHWEGHGPYRRWVEGYRAAPAYGYAAPGWRGDERRWRHERRWERRRDRDHDGVPDRYDRDRDGDGVPNRYDRRPNNPYRY